MDERPIRVGVNLLWLVPSGVGGSEEATVNSLRAVGDHGDGSVELVLFGTAELRTTYPDLADRFAYEVISVDATSRPRRIWAENTALRSAEQRADLDLVHHGGGTIPLRAERPTTVTIHDLQPMDQPQNFTPLKRLYLGAALRLSTRRAAAVAVPSDFVAGGVRRQLRVDQRRIFVIPWCVARPPAARSNSSTGKRSSPYFLYPAVTWPHKNHAVLIRAFERVAERCDADLLLTGSPGPAHDEVMSQISASPACSRIHHLGRIPRDGLDRLMTDALAVVFPSSYEGFGMPVAEATSLGVPLIVSSAGSLPEIVGPGYDVVAPTDVTGWSDGMIAVANDRRIRAMMCSASESAARRFAPERTARGYLDMWRHVHLGIT